MQFPNRGCQLGFGLILRLCDFIFGFHTMLRLYVIVYVTKDVSQNNIDM